MKKIDLKSIQEFPVSTYEILNELVPKYTGYKFNQNNAINSAYLSKGSELFNIAHIHKPHAWESITSTLIMSQFYHGTSEWSENLELPTPRLTERLKVNVDAFFQLELDEGYELEEGQELVAPLAQWAYEGGPGQFYTFVEFSEEEGNVTRHEIPIGMEGFKLYLVVANESTASKNFRRIYTDTKFESKEYDFAIHPLSYVLGTAEKIEGWTPPTEGGGEGGEGGEGEGNGEEEKLEIKAGNEERGFIGEIKSEDFLSISEKLHPLVKGMTGVVTTNADSDWLHLVKDGYEFVTTKKHIAQKVAPFHLEKFAIDEENLADEAMVFDDTGLGGEWYLTLWSTAGEKGDKYNVLGSDWNTLIHPLCDFAKLKHEDRPYPEWIDEDLEDWGVHYTEEDLEVRGEAIGASKQKYGSFTLTRTAHGSDFLARGHNGASYVNPIEIFDMSATNGWRPLFIKKTKLNEDPNPPVEPPKELRTDFYVQFQGHENGVEKYGVVKRPQEIGVHSKTPHMIEFKEYDTPVKTGENRFEKSVFEDHSEDNIRVLNGGQNCHYIVSPEHKSGAEIVDRFNFLIKDEVKEPVAVVKHHHVQTLDVAFPLAKSNEVIVGQAKVHYKGDADLRILVMTPSQYSLLKEEGYKLSLYRNDTDKLAQFPHYQVGDKRMTVATPYINEGKSLGFLGIKRADTISIEEYNNGEFELSPSGEHIAYFLPFDDGSIEQLEVEANTLVKDFDGVRLDSAKLKLNLEITNNDPTGELEVKANKINLKLEDADGDDIFYRVKVNGEYYYPDTEGNFQELGEDGVFTHFIDEEFLAVEKENNVTVEFKDNIGETQTLIQTFNALPYGLVFTDNEDKLYSDTEGETIRIYEIDGTKDVKLVNMRKSEVSNVRVSIVTKEGMQITGAEFTLPNGEVVKEELKLYQEEQMEHGDVIEFKLDIPELEEGTEVYILALVNNEKGEEIINGQI